MYTHTIHIRANPFLSFLQVYLATYIYMYMCEREREYMYLNL